MIIIRHNIVLITFFSHRNSSYDEGIFILLTPNFSCQPNRIGLTAHQYLLPLADLFKSEGVQKKTFLHRNLSQLWFNLTQHWTHFQINVSKWAYLQHFSSTLIIAVSINEKNVLVMQYYGVGLFLLHRETIS